ncbi:guanosine-3',5'-bis(diphosphate) 3'-pyrophosphohydrolase-like [Hibiscus syriacus]|uniref:Guanosine-3',5'-bis(Diphosphate) 3'-pyrophosphohydrolase-like n=1 Tax=Hibiscus syriacus TaxID=106335 RepID=A0A6A2XLY8_HIBSY|nr:guanosine-3',5'-bis(diphosphate) 3'-pyrophosphohydrolase-like [Hibiscus syriacus]
MSGKKIIAICQSAGDFVTNKDGSLSYNGGEAYAIDVDEQTKLSETSTVDVFIMSEEAVAPNISIMPASRSRRTTISEVGVPIVAPASANVDGMNDGIDQIDMDMPDETPLDCMPINMIDGRHLKAAQLWENTITGVDQRFNSFNEFREALHKYSIAHGFAYTYKKNDNHRVTVKCKAKGCPWRIYASRLSTTWLICIKRMNTTHTCEGASLKAGYRATRGWVGSIVKEKL